MEAAHPGGEAEDGALKDANAYSDADFASDLSATQAPAEYGRAAVYRRSLLTQTVSVFMQAQEALEEPAEEAKRRGWV
ncbi:uncharacterized protein PHACADRAFT_211194 [Phanerochaete carnosa HHB-10118-sp]|uniref:Uncharacterized protein n=1 Tax=Phanerochaete carnosa (strain HHB-10118-sp) TaxID=650164 RepID=K5UU33_PHACS|nr:uncharacterized protein PHACADRAFT_211194 [Phanerochaete carnosa HHB-10118-sp]EKM53501.1 hypothetical protein PHACADRAFT_211194 [Phanerochaete carnosa HHB-10118-sp]